MKAVDLFCGCGGMSLGFTQAGFEIISAYDNWDKAIDVYTKNFSHPAHNVDLSDEELTCKSISQYTPDIIIGGPPCQDFSSAGKRDTSLGRADLTYSYANIITTIKPKWFVMENVDRIRKSHILTEVIEQFNKTGYGLTAVILNASFCSVPQARNRFFLIGEMGGLNNALLVPLKEGLSASPMTLRDYLGEKLQLTHYYRHPRNYSRRGVFSIDEPSPTIRGVNRPVPRGYTKHCGDPVDVHLEKIRPLTTKERSMVQTFPETFILDGTKTNLEQMVGNAVPVNLAKYVANSILRFQKSKEKYDTLVTTQFDLFGNAIDDKVIIPDSYLK